MGQLCRCAGHLGPEPPEGEGTTTECACVMVIPIDERISDESSGCTYSAVGVRRSRRLGLRRVDALDDRQAEQKRCVQAFFRR